METSRSRQTRRSALQKHETTDVNARSVLWFAVILVIVAVLVHGVIAWLQNDLQKVYPSSSPLSRFGRRTMEPPAPVLQTDPVADMNRLRAEEEQKLNSFAWIDRKAGIARIPVDKAIDMVLQRGLPKTGAPQDRGAVLPTPAATPSSQ